MRPAEGYRSRIGPSAGAPMPGSSAASFGAGAARGLEQLGDTAHRANVSEYVAERKLKGNREWSAFQVAFAEAREAQAAEAREARESDEPGHAERMRKSWRDREQALIGMLSEEGYRDRAKASMATWGSAFRDSEAEWETVRTAEIVTEQYRQGLNTSANRVRRLEKPEDYVLEMKLELDMIEGLDVPDKTKDALEKEAKQSLAIAFLQGRIDDDPAVAKALLDSGSFDSILEQEQVEALLNGSAVEIRRAQAQAAQLVSQQQSAVRDALSLFAEKEGNGTADYAQLPALRAQAEALGMEKQVEQIDGYMADELFAREYAGAPPVQLEQRLAVLNGKGDQASEAEKRERKWIEGHLPGIEGRFNSDPVGYFARDGGALAPPPIDFTDPGSIAAREKWARSMGVPHPFTGNEIAALERIYGEGREGRETAIGLLASLSPAQAMRAAREMDPDDKALPVVVTLDQNHRALALRGRAKLREEGDFLSRHTKDDIELEEAIGGLEARVEQALRSVAPEQRAEILAAAQAMSAGAMDKHGSPLSEKVYWNAIQTALGARKTADGQLAGGIGRWGENYFLMPAGVTPREFGRQVRAAARTAEVKPVNPDGSPVNLTRNVFPVAVQGGWYEFRTAGGRVVMGDNGKPWRVRPKGGE